VEHVKDKFGLTQPTKFELHTEDGEGVDVDLVAGGAQVVVAGGREQGRRCVIDDEIIVGRDPDCTLQLSDEGVSRKHARIRRTPGSVYLIEDLGSRNGTKVNDVTCQGQIELSFGDRIRLGLTTVLMFTRNDRAEEHLLRTQKLQTLGELAGGVAHDFNNLLGVVLMHLGVLAEVGGLDDDGKESLEEAELATRRAIDLSRRLLAFARGGGQRKEYTDIAKLVAESMRIVLPTLPTTIEVEEDLAPRLGVLGDPSQLSQIVLNLCLNAADAMPDGGKLTIKSELIVVAKDDPRRPQITPGKNVRLTVRDTGVGMDGEQVSRMFEPFFTSKGGGKGTGLGLATVYRIVDDHWGYITVESEPDRGTSVQVYLPATDPPKESRAAGPRSPTGVIHQKVRGGTVLVVDDQAMARHAIGRLLQRMGLKVVTANDGNEALRAYADHKDQIALIILDLDMPNLDGANTHRILRRSDPDVRVLVCSGRLDYDTEQELAEAGVLGFLQKPFDARDLTAAVRRALGEET
jgi:signal transduction histidine kinase/CheY-like chemotaxis protein